MDIKTFSHHLSKGWSVPEFPAMDSSRTVIFVFGAPEYLQRPEAIHELVTAYPKSVIVGCSSSGEILGPQVFDQSLAVAVVKFKETDIKVVSLPIPSAEDSFDIGKTIAHELGQNELAGVMVLSDGLHINGTTLVSGINSVFNHTVTITGGLAGDGARFQETWVLHAGRPCPRYITAIGFYGKKIRMGHGSKGGWDIFGPERTITRSRSNVLYELDGKPALKLYKEYLGEKASELPASGLLFPLQIRADRNDPKKIVRTILSVDEKEQALIFAGDIPEGSLAQLMRANFDRLIEGASEAAASIKDLSTPVLLVSISCVGRRLVLGERTEEETEATLSMLPPGGHQIGFYSYGEISPYVKGSSCEFHNQTMTVTALSEEE